MAMDRPWEDGAGEASEDGAGEASEDSFRCCGTYWQREDTSSVVVALVGYWFRDCVASLDGCSSIVTE